MRGAVSFDSVKKELLKHPGIKSAYDKEHVSAVVALQITELRERHRLSQKELAKKLHTTQQTISKIENPDNNVTIGTLEKIANIFDRKLIVKFAK
ncbi:MAG: helix-turn-helix transcriptional regulator [Elusimicrobiota bacterium]